MPSSRLLLASLLLLAAAPRLSAQALQGRLRDDRNDRAVALAAVSAIGADSAVVASDTTRSDGSFRLVLPGAGRYRVRIEAEDYVPTLSNEVEVKERDTLRVSLRVAADHALEKALVVLGRNGRSVVLESAGFYDRRRMGPGLFFTRADLERRRALSLSDFLRNQPGIRAVNRGSGRVSVISGRGGVVCFPRIFVDGTPTSSQDIDLVATPHDVEGMEVYRGSSEVPVQYTGMRTPCGAIVLWMRVEVEEDEDEVDRDRGEGGESPLTTARRMR